MKKEINALTIKSITGRQGQETGISVARDQRGDLCALREKDGEVRFVGYVRDYPQFCEEVRAGVGFAYDNIKWKFGYDVEFYGRIMTDLKAARIEAGLTQKDVAENIGIEQSSVARLESGAHSPSLDMVERYAEAVGCRLKIEKKEEK